MCHMPEAGCLCGNSACADLCGGRGDLRPYRNPFKSSGSRLTFDVRAPGGVAGIKVIVTYPMADLGPKLVKASNPDLPRPELKHFDAIDLL